MSILAFILSLFGLALAPVQPAQDPAGETTMAVDQQVPAKQVPEQDSLVACQKSHHYAKLRNTLLEGKARVQPVFASRTGDFKKLERTWNEFAAAMPYHVQFVLLSPKFVVLDASDVQKSEPFPDSIIVDRLMIKTGGISEYALPVVYWDFEAAAQGGYDWNNDVYMRFLADALADPEGRYNEQLFLEWLVFTHD